MAELSSAHHVSPLHTACFRLSSTGGLPQWPSCTVPTTPLLCTQPASGSTAQGAYPNGRAVRCPPRLSSAHSLLPAQQHRGHTPMAELYGAHHASPLHTACFRPNSTGGLPQWPSCTVPTTPLLCTQPASGSTAQGAFPNGRAVRCPPRLSSTHCLLPAQQHRGPSPMAELSGVHHVSSLHTVWTAFVSTQLYLKNLEFGIKFFVIFSAMLRLVVTSLLLLVEETRFPGGIQRLNPRHGQLSHMLWERL